MDWIDAIGYEQEVLHAGALFLLLDQEQRRRQFAEALVGEPIWRVGDPERQGRIGPNRRRPTDVVVPVTLSGQNDVLLGIELKVDSAWDPQQLRDTVAPPNRGLLLALGCTAMAATSEELPNSWRLMLPREWAILLEANGRGIARLDDYRRHVEHEARCHAEALDRVRKGRAVEEGREPVTLEHWAYFHEVVAKTHIAGRWERKTLVSGPLLTLWLDVTQGVYASAYIELMGKGDRRELCIKCGTEGRDPAEVQRKLSDALSDSGVLSGARRSRRASPGDKSCTALTASLDGFLPSKAAVMCDEVATLLRGS
jgi:hypothetical protein